MPDDFDTRFALPIDQNWVGSNVPPNMESALVKSALPIDYQQPLINDYQLFAGTNAGRKLIADEDRFKTWPEEMVRSGATLPGDVFSGKESIVDPATNQTADNVIKRTQDLAGMATTVGMPMAAEGALGSAGGKLFSNLERVVSSAKMEKGTPEQWLGYLKNNGVRNEELEFSLKDLPTGQITKSQLEQHVAENGVKVNENPNPTYQGNEKHYSSWQLPGANNYRELTLTLPTPMREYNTFVEGLRVKYGEGGLANKPLTESERLRLDHLQEKAGDDGVKPYQSSHWDEPNVLAHIRMNDRDIPGVGKSLHVEEVQSDWHQVGRKQGYRDTEKIKQLETKLEQLNNEIRNLPSDKSDPTQANRTKKLELTQERDKLNEEWNDLSSNYRGIVPNAPFKKTWDELALKKVLTKAVEEGKDAVSWTPGEAQAARYDLSKHYDNIQIVKRQDGTYNVFGAQKGHGNHTNPIQDHVPENKLSDIVGKELAEKAVKGQEDFSGVDLKVGGEGMKTFYDKMLVDKANNLVKKMGGKVEYYDIPETVKKTLTGFGPTIPGVNKAPYIKITPEMRKSISEKGFPLFSAPTFVQVDSNPFEDAVPSMSVGKIGSQIKNITRDRKLIPVQERPVFPGEVI